MRSRFIMLLGVLVLVAGACANGTEEAVDTAARDVLAEIPEDVPAETPEPEDADDVPAETTVACAWSESLGDILVDGEGFTLYAFMPDEQGMPTCTGDCVGIWPPVEGPAEAGDGVDAALLGTVEHPDGPTQVTYNDWPLYRFSGDLGPGDIDGQGVGDNWYVVGPMGLPNTEAMPGTGPQGPIGPPGTD